MNAEKKQKQQEQIQQQERMIQRRKEICAKYSEIGKFIHARDKWVNMLLLLGLILHIAQAVLMKTFMDASTFLAVAMVLGYWKYLLILLLCKSTEVKVFHAGGIFCVAMFGLNLMKIMKTVDYSFGNLIYVYREMFRVSPWIAASDLLTWIFFFVVLITILYLGFAPKSRRLIEQFAQLLKSEPSGENYLD